MDDYNFSFVHKSLTRQVTMGSIPAQWLWSNILSCIFIVTFILLALPFYLSVFIVPLIIIIFFLLHFFLCKAYTKDEIYFSVFFRYLLSKDLIYSTSRVNYKQEKYN